MPWQEFNDIAAWDRLADNAAEPNPFFESWYLLPSLRAIPDAANIQLLLFKIDGKLAGLMPVQRSSRYYHLPIPNLSGWLHANCFLGVPLVEKGCEVPFWQALLDWADENAGAALFLHLREIPVGGPLHVALKGVLAGGTRQAELVHAEDRAMLCSELGSESYWEASLSTKKRKELRRQAKRLADEGDVRFDRQTGSEGLDDWIGSFLRLEASGWKGSAGSALASDDATEALFRESLKGAAERGKLERLSLSLNDEPIAMLATFLTPPGTFSYKTAFDESYARFSPGVLLQQHNLALLDQDDIDWCDSCAAEGHPMIDHIWRERRRLGRFSIAIGGPLRRSLFRRIVNLETSRTNKGDVQ